MGNNKDTKSSKLFDTIRAAISQPIPTDDTPDDTMFGPDADASEEEILQGIKVSGELDNK